MHHFDYRDGILHAEGVSLADIAAKYLHKGSEVALEGKLVHRAYDDKGGQKRTFTEINVNDLVLVGSKKD